MSVDGACVRGKNPAHGLSSPQQLPQAGEAPLFVGRWWLPDIAAGWKARAPGGGSCVRLPQAVGELLLDMENQIGGGASHRRQSRALNMMNAQPA